MKPIENFQFETKAPQLSDVVFEQKSDLNRKVEESEKHHITNEQEAMDISSKLHSHDVKFQQTEGISSPVHEEFPSSPNHTEKGDDDDETKSAREKLEPGNKEVDEVIN